MDSFTRYIVGLNLLVLLLAAGLLRYFNRGVEAGFSYMLGMARVIGGLLLLNLLSMLIADEHYKDYLLAMLLVLLIGFGMCIGGLATF